MSGAFALCELWPSGLLQRLLLGTTRPSGPPRPALVVPRPKPKPAWLRADCDSAAAKRALPREERQETEELCRVGVWDEMQLDPRL